MDGEKVRLDANSKEDENGGKEEEEEEKGKKRGRGRPKKFDSQQTKIEDFTKGIFQPKNQLSRSPAKDNQEKTEKGNIEMVENLDLKKSEMENTDRVEVANKDVVAAKVIEEKSKDIDNVRVNSVEREITAAEWEVKIVDIVKEQLREREAWFNEKEERMLVLLGQVEEGAARAEEAEKKTRQLRDEIVSLFNNWKNNGKESGHDNNDQNPAEAGEKQESGQGEERPIVVNESAERINKKSKDSVKVAEDLQGLQGSSKSGPMKKCELVWEFKEREKRRKNIKVRGVRTAGAGYREEI